EIDTGDILFAERTPIGPDETAGELHDKLMHLGAKLLVKTVRAIADGSAVPQAQDDFTAELPRKEAPKIFKEHTRIDWDKPVQLVYNQVRALSPYPAAFTYFQDKLLKIYRARMVSDSSSTGTDHGVAPGSVQSDGKTYLRFYAQGGYLEVLELQAEGKRKMEVNEFLRGV